MTFRRVFSKGYDTYKRTASIAFSRKYLLYTNILLSASISTCGDLIEQSYEYHTNTIEKYDFNRVAQMSFSGGVAGVLCHHWYIFLDKLIVGRSLHMALKKLMLDQFIWSPIVILSFFASVAIFEDDPLENFTEEVRDKFWTLYKAEWVVWPPAQMINFYFLPTRFRVLYDNTISLAYDVYTSKVKNSARRKQTDPSKSNAVEGQNTESDDSERKRSD